MLVALSLISLVAFFTTQRLTDDQERRVLEERAEAVEALLASSVNSIASSLRALGPIGASSDADVDALFEETATQLLTGNTRVIGVIDQTDSDELAKVVTAESVGAVEVTPDHLDLAARADSAGMLVTDLVTGANGDTVLRLAVPVAGTRSAIYMEIALDPGVPVPSTPESSFRALEVSLYAAPTADIDQLILTTEESPEISGRTATLPMAVGADQWLLVVGQRGSLVGWLNEYAQWLFLLGGVVTAVLVTTIVEIVARRRVYAEREVEQQTEALQAARAFLQRLLDAGPVVVAIIEPDDAHISYLSPNIERLYQLSPPNADLDKLLAGHLDPSAISDIQASVARIADEQSTIETVECQLLDGDGNRRWVSVTLVPMIGRDESVDAVLAYLIDVDDRRTAEDARRLALEAAESANREKTDFLSRMSHELRTPLNAVLGFGQLLDADDLDHDQRDAVDHILKGGRHLLDLINEVLDISRIEAGELSLSPEPVLVTDLVREAVDLMRPLASEREIQLVTDDAAGACDCYAYTDHQRSKQVLLNLLSNGIKYNRRHGTVAVSCSTDTDRSVKINVADTGTGIPAERLELLFEPFERLGAEQTSEEGTGIGLALSRRLAEAMGGTLDVTSTLGAGSTFTLSLPLVEGPTHRYERLNGGGSATADPAPSPESATDRRHVVLHIEDNLANLSLIEKILDRRPEIQVVAAMQGQLGIELAREHRPLAVLLDLHLPDMDGHDVLTRLLEDPDTASIPVVIISADATQRRIQRLLNAGAAAYLTKPINVHDLLRVMDDIAAERLGT